MVSLSTLAVGIFLLGLAVTSLERLQKYRTSSLKKVPGPFLARFSNLWRFLDAYGGRSELTQRTLHEKYGSAVRLGPNIVSLSDPALLRTIYNTRGDFLKASSTKVS